MLSFIHAGDVHLGNPFTGLSKDLPNQFSKAIQEAGYQAFDALIERAVAEQVDFVLFPGDLLHGAGRSAKVQATLVRGFLTLQEVGIQVLLSFGNHDYEAFNTLIESLPENVHVFGQQVEEKMLRAKDGQSVAFSGFSYADRAERRDRLAEFSVKNGQADYEIGLYHGSVGQSGDDYAAFAIQDMLKKGYDYWALGHIHVRQILYEEKTIAYSGNLQGLNRKEEGPKGALLVRERQGVLQPEFLDLAPVRFEEVSFDNVSSLVELVQQMKDLRFEKKSFLSVCLTGRIGEEVREAFTRGDLLEQVQHAMGKENFWPIHVDLAEVEVNEQPAFASVSFEQAIDETVTSELLQAHLSKEVPLEVRDYFNQEEGQAAVRQALQRLFAQGGKLDEN
ncbi:DNA repair exonuclease [Fructobacillus sp. M1-13]|uniref:DNA repair exonuclease n=1 Tax=Fructobacillus papyriferae TaxID=2713171 RepID=A0ABS5QNT6_9LACO|nr:DNA repair exonuclease [Fructobacillus papyriferae]MBS9334793.1 DNA repair exonuclease [Fructobacillus papyriferae]MCD2158783.1 DNA repair exonuclease [Fructobacillus papyriferae]